MSDLYELARPFPDNLIMPPPAGKHGDYVNHADLTQRALSIVGPFNFEVIELIRGHAPDEFSRDGELRGPARDGAVVGCIGRLTVDIDGCPVVISEVGSVDNPASENDGENAKKAASDALKRCWMRTGLGLHLWSKHYFLEAQLMKEGGTDGRHQETESTSGGEAETLEGIT